VAALVSGDVTAIHRLCANGFDQAKVTMVVKDTSTAPNGKR
jgi:hypothetical protein